jgi:N-acetylglucosaminyldiphosphoundecaprenol N-acetyl-beta-D-mannosaminyltransferase
MVWPDKHSLFGVEVSASRFDEAVDAVVAAAAQRKPALVTALAVHGLMVASGDPEFQEIVNGFHLVTPDGHPVKSALNLLCAADLPSRVSGPDLMLRLCEKAADERVDIYLYGSREPVVQQLAANLTAMFPALRIAGHERSLFRPLSEAEDADLVERINASGAGIVFIGMGCPLQERFAHAHRDRIQAVQVCVGAAFDFHSGSLQRAPQWMQHHGLEWLYRLLQEPHRLWRRYALTNTEFVLRLAHQLMIQSFMRPSAARATRK